MSEQPDHDAPPLRVKVFGARPPEQEPTAELPPHTVALLAFLNGGELPPDLAGHVRDMFAAQEQYRQRLERGLSRVRDVLVAAAGERNRTMELPTAPGAEHTKGFTAGLYMGASEAAKLIQLALNEAGS